MISEYGAAVIGIHSMSQTLELFREAMPHIELGKTYTIRITQDEDSGLNVDVMHEYFVVTRCLELEPAIEKMVVVKTLEDNFLKKKPKTFWQKLKNCYKYLTANEDMEAITTNCDFIK